MILFFSRFKFFILCLVLFCFCVSPFIAFGEDVDNTKTIKSKLVNKDDSESSQVEKLNVSLAESNSSENSPEVIDEKLRKMEKRLNDLKSKLPEPDKKKKAVKEEEIRHKKLISAAGKKYVLISPGVLGVEYSFSYTGQSYDQVERSEVSGTHIERVPTHTIVNKISMEYPLKRNLAFLMDIPFVSVYDDQQGKTNVDDLGDPYLGILFQPVRERRNKPAVVVSAGISFPMGRSPYEINPETDFPTGQGVMSTNLGINLSKRFDPVLIYGGLFYSYKLATENLTFKNSLYLGESGEQLERIKPGDEYGFSAGIGHVLSDSIQLSLAYRFAFQTATTYQWRGRGKKSSPSTFTSRMFFGTGWQITEKRKVYMDIGLGLTNNDEDFLLEIRVPFNFIL